MKLAICFSGHIRTFEKTYESCKKHLIDLYDSDVFIHTWSTMGTSRPEDKGGDGILTQNKIDYIKSVYSPNLIVVEPQKEFKIRQHMCFSTARTPPINVVSKWYSARQSNWLRKQWEDDTKTQYDAIISVRSDMLFHEDVKIEIPDTKKLYLPGNISVPKDTFHDYMAFGTPDVMDSYFDTGKYFDLVCEKLTNFRPEAVLTKYIHTLSIPIKYFNTYYSIVRMNGEVLEMNYREFPQ